MTEPLRGPDAGPLAHSAEGVAERSGDSELEWQRVVRALAQRAVGPLHERPSFPVHTTREGAQAALRRTREALSLDELGEPLPLSGWPDITRNLLRLERQGDLDGSDLRELVQVLSAARVLRLFLGRHREGTPALRERLEFPVEVDELEDLLSRALEADGSVSSHASPELARLRTEVANLRARLVRRLEGMLESRGDILQERYYTEREGRYVLPVRADAHERLHGILHATSASGATLFIEPRELVEQGNRLKMARAEMVREEARILSQLSASSREQIPAMTALVDALDEADRRRASARLALDLHGLVVDLDDDDVLDLQAARHPLLVLDGADVVANDLSVAAGSALLLSGPNAGGKTVALKTLGLCALMVRAGLPIAAAEGSRVGFFAPVRTDLGDHQSTQQNLSTFSAHISHVADILGDARQGSLVLLDELAGGTSPEEGAALASAIVLELCERGAATVTTTHYPELKALGVSHPKVMNAAVAFDVERMRPTFRVQLGITGTSCALPVARRFGIPDAVIERARAALPEARLAAEVIATEIERLRAEAVADRDAAAQLRIEAEARTRETSRRREQESLRLAKERERVHASLRELVRSARSDLKQVRRQLRDAPAAETLRQVEVKVQEIEQQMPAPSPQALPPPEALSAPLLTNVEVGARAWVPELRRVAEILELGKRGRVRVAAGSLKCWVDGAGLREAVAAPPAPARPPSPPRVSRADEISPRGDANSLDLRGLRVDDALSLVDTFLDRLYGEGVDAAYLLHGHGTGALRQALREHLERGQPTVRGFRPGHPKEGGDALTVVALA